MAVFLLSSHIVAKCRCRAASYWNFVNAGLTCSCYLFDSRAPLMVAKSVAASPVPSQAKCLQEAWRLMASAIRRSRTQTTSSTCWLVSSPLVSATMPCKVAASPTTVRTTPQQSNAMRSWVDVRSPMPPLAIAPIRLCKGMMLGQLPSPQAKPSLIWRRRIPAWTFPFLCSPTRCCACTRLTQALLNVKEERFRDSQLRDYRLNRLGLEIYDFCENLNSILWIHS